MIAWFKSALAYTCPRCRSSQMFVQPMDFKKPLAMKPFCEHCDLNFEPEPGFYFGAMFVSYTITAFSFLGSALLLVFYFKWSVNAAMAFVIFLGIISYFWVMRVSRSLYIHVIVQFDKEKSKQ